MYTYGDRVGLSGLVVRAPGADLRLVAARHSSAGETPEKNFTNFLAGVVPWVYRERDVRATLTTK